MNEFPKGRLEPVLGSAAKILITRKNVFAASILANAEATLRFWHHDNWDGGQDFWRLFLGIPAEVYLNLTNKEELERTINEAIAIPLHAVSSSDFIECEITTSLDEDPDWRLRVRQHVSGADVTNQGRVRSDNIAHIEHDGLRFRSRPEVFLYAAIKSAGVPFAPLPVVIQGGIQYHRLEPDFLIFYQGLAMIVEIDGDNFHNEKPADAHARIKILSDQGVRVERIKHTACNTPEKAREAVQNIIATLKKIKSSM